MLLKMMSASELQKLDPVLLNSNVSGNDGSYFLVTHVPLTWQLL